jgi:hypothetical protein
VLLEYETTSQLLWALPDCNRKVVEESPSL